MSQSTLRRVLPFPSSRNLFPVSCDVHGSANYGYTVCLCVAKSFLPVAAVAAPMPNRMGIVICGRAEQHRPEEFVLMCAKCVKERGLDQKGNRLL